MPSENLTALGYFAVGSKFCSFSKLPTVRPTYATEAFALLVQEKFLFSPRMLLHLMIKWNGKTNRKSIIE